MEVVEKKKGLVPKLRFREFEEEWEKKKLGECCSVIMGQSPDSKSYNDKGEGYYLIQGNADIKNRLSSPRQWTNEPTKKCKVGDVILTVRAPVGAVAKSVHDACIGRGVSVIRKIDGYEINFVYQFLLDFESKWGRLEQGSTFTAVSGSDIKGLKLNLPTLPEQQKIAAFLSAVDEKIQQLTKKKALLEQYKKGVMQKLFPKKAGQAPELRFKKPDGSNYPDWEEKKLNEISEPIKRTSETPLEEIMTISGANGFLSQKERFSQVIAGSSLSKYTHLLEGEFAYNRGNSKSFKYGCIYKMPIKEALIPYVYHCFKFHEGNNTDFYQQLFLHKYLDRQLRRLISSSARMDGLLNIGAKEFFKVKLPKPCLEEQERIGKFLSGIDQKINQAATQINQTQTFKKGLLQQMFV